MLSNLTSTCTSPSWGCNVNPVTSTTQAASKHGETIKQRWTAAAPASLKTKKDRPTAVQTWVRHLPFCHDLLQQDAVWPHVWLDGELAIQRSFRGSPFDGELGTCKQRKPSGTDLGKCTHHHDEKQGNNNTQTLSTIRLLQVKEGWQTTKEEGSEEEDRQEEAGVRNVEDEYLR